MFVPFVHNAYTSGFVNPLSSEVQCAPLSADENTPYPNVPLNMLFPLTASVKLLVYIKRLFTAAPLFPESSEKNIPPPFGLVKMLVPLLANQK